MIRLKQLLNEIQGFDLNQISRQIVSNDFQYIGAGDNGRVYKLNNKDLIFKITTSIDELEVARKLQNKIYEYSTFIPVYYVGNLLGVQTKYNDIIIMANAEPLQTNQKQQIDQIVGQFKQYAYDKGGEVSLFDFIDNNDTTNLNISIINFIQSLRIDIQNLDIPELDLDLDFKSENIMIWNGNMVMVDW